MDRNKGKNKSNKNLASNKKSTNKNVKTQEKGSADIPILSESKTETPEKLTTEIIPPTNSKQSGVQIKKSNKNVAPILAPPPDPVFVLRGAPCPIASVQFLSPALRLDELTPSQFEVLTASPSGSGGGMALLKLPPPGFLNPTTHIAAGLLNGQIIIWDLKTKQQSLCWQAHPQTSSVLCIKNVSETELVSLGGKDSLKLWYLEPAKPGAANDGSCTAVFPAGATPVCRVQISLADYLGFSDCDVFCHSNCVVAALPGKLQDAVSVWSLGTKVNICQLRVNEDSKVGSVMQLKWIEKKGTVALAVVYESGDLCLWDWSNVDIYSNVRVNGTPLCLEYDQSLGTGIIGTAQESIFLFIISNNFEVSLIKEMSFINEGIGCCISRPDSKIYVTGGWDSRLRVFSWQTSKLLAVLDFHTNSTSCLHYSASRVQSYEGTECGAEGVGPTTAGTEHMLAAGSLDGSISLWKIY